MKIATNPTLIMTPSEYEAITAFCQSLVTDLSSLSNDDFVSIISNIADEKKAFVLWDSDITISVQVSEGA